MSNGNLPFVSIITVNYNGKAFLDDCFSSLLLLNYPKDRLEIIMVDNGSVDGSLDYVKNKFPSVKILSNQINNYALANNLGIKSSKGECIAFINNDVRVDKEWLINLIQCVESSPGIGAVGSKILSMDGALLSLGHVRMPNFYWIDIEKVENDGPIPILPEVISICGCSVLYKKECLEDVGFFDEDFKMYLEDVDMAIRARKHNWKMVTSTGSIIYHYLNGTIKDKSQVRYWQERNRLLLIAKHWPNKLADALYGKGYFFVLSGLKKDDNARKMATVLKCVFNKLVKEHGSELANRLMPKIINLSKQLYKLVPIYKRGLKQKEQEIAQLKKELKRVWGKEVNSRSKQLDKIVSIHKEESRKKELEIAKLNKELKRIWDEEINPRIKETDLGKHEITTLRNELQRVWDEEVNPRLKELGDRNRNIEGLQAIVVKKEEEIRLIQEAQARILSEITNNRNEDITALQVENNLQSMSLLDKKQVIANLTETLERKNRELDQLYTSTAYRYLVRPMWDIIFPIKKRLASLTKIKLLPHNLFLTIPKLDFFHRIAEFSGRAQELYHNVFLNHGDKNIYHSHIHRGTYPLMPTRMTLMITRICNMHCKFCDIPDVKEVKQFMAKEEALRAISSLVNLGIREVVFTGGEPLLHPDLFEIVDYARSQGLKTAITTNGLLLEKYMDSIVRCPPHFMCVSVDGTKEIHDELRNYPGAYDKIMQGVELLVKNKITTTVNFVVTNKNIFFLEQIYNEFTNRGISVYFLPVINKPDLFPSAENERIFFLCFIAKLKQIHKISTYDYEYLRMAITSYSRYAAMWTRCLGLSSELGIDTDGTISPCCVWANRKDQLNGLGNIFKDNIIELWHSDKFRNARYSIFKDGCKNCFNPSILDARKFAGVDFIVRTTPKLDLTLLKNKITEQKELISKPDHVHMRFTTRCNLRCRHCDIWKLKAFKSRELSIEHWKLCVDKLHSWLGNYLVDLAGGEILLYPGAVDLIQHCANKGIVVNLTTNGTLIDESMAEKLAHSGVRCINISIDGLADTHAYTRNQKDILRRLENSVGELTRYKTIPHIAMATVITKYNLDELPQLIRLPEKWGISSISFQALDNNFGSKYHANWPRNNEFWPTDKEKIERAFNFLIAERKSHEWIYNSVEQLSAMKNYYQDPTKVMENKCSTGDRNFIVEEQGNVLLCWNMPSVGNLVKDDPEQIWNSPAAWKMRENISNCKRTCRMLNCNYLHVNAQIC